MSVSADVCFSRDLSGLGTGREAKVAPYGAIVPNTLLRHVFTSLGSPVSAPHDRGSHMLSIMGQGSCHHNCT